MSVQTGPLGRQLAMGPNGFSYQGIRGLSVAGGQNGNGQGLVVNGPKRDFAGSISSQGEINAIFRGSGVGTVQLA